MEAKGSSGNQKVNCVSPAMATVKAKLYFMDTEG